MLFSNIEYTIKYVDPSKSTNGDGSSIIDAMNQLPTTDAGYTENTCYLIRRTAEATAVTIPSITCNRKNFLFVGMPKSTDLLYQQIPQIAKDEWGDDEYEYANVKSVVNDGRFIMPNVLNFNMFRIYLYRSNLDPKNQIFYSEKSDYTTQVSFVKCKFGALGVDLDDNTYTTAQTAQRSCNFVYFYYIKTFIMQDCLINFCSPVAGSYYGFYTRRSQFVSITDVTVNNVFQSTYYTNYPFYFDNGDSSRPCTAYVENLNMNIKFNNNYTYVPYLIYLRNADVLTFKNCNIGITGSLGTTSPTNVQLYNYIMYFSESRQYNISNVHVGLPGVWNVESSGACLNLESFFNGNYAPGNKQSIKNIYITMEEEAGISNDNGSYYDRAKHTSHDRYAVFRCSVSNNDDNRIPKYAILENININNIRGVAAYLYCCQIRDARFRGSVKMQYCVADIESIDSYYPAYALFLASYTTCRVQRITMKLDNESAPPAEEPVIYNFQGDDRYYCYVDFCNVRLRPNVASTNNYNNDPAAICANEVETGHFSHRASNYIVDTWTVARQGGAPASLKLYNNAYNSSYELWLGKEPFGGSKLTAPETGLNYLLVYIAYKGFANEDDLGSKVMVQASVPDGTGNYKRYYSNVNGTWINDTTSVWDGDNGLTCKLLMMPLDIVTTAEQVDLKIKFSWYSAAGFVYIDPAFTLYPASQIPNMESSSSDVSESSLGSESSISSSSEGV